MTNQEYIAKLADIYVDAGVDMTALRVNVEEDPDGWPPERWLPKAEAIAERVETQLAEMPTEITG